VLFNYGAASVPARTATKELLSQRNWLKRTSARGDPISRDHFNCGTMMRRRCGNRLMSAAVSPDEIQPEAKNNRSKGRNKRLNVGKLKLPCCAAAGKKTI
jgi:hypothetical protein